MANDNEKRPVHAVYILVVSVSKLNAVTPPKSAKVSINMIIHPPNIQGRQLGISTFLTISVVDSPMVLATGHCDEPMDCIARVRGIVKYGDKYRLNTKPT